MLGEIGVQPHHIEAILNHYSGHRSGVAGVYQRAKYADEMRSALQRWADHLDQITAWSAFVKELNMTALQGWIVIGLLVLIMLGIVGIGAEIEALPWLWRTYNP